MARSATIPAPKLATAISRPSETAKSAGQKDRDRRRRPGSDEGVSDNDASSAR
jgi:hypothetical protein